MVRPMTVKRMTRAAVWARAPAFTAVLHDLQRVCYSDWPALWDAPDAGPMPRFAGPPLVLAPATASARIDRYATQLARATARWMTAMGWPTLHALGLSPRSAWQGRTDAQRPPYPALARALARLPAPGLPARFRGALVFSAAGCAQALPLCFWAARCGTLGDGPLLGAADQPWVASLCQHGNLHVEVYDAGLRERLLHTATASGWAPVQGACARSFGRAQAGIPGRNLLR